MMGPDYQVAVAEHLLKIKDFHQWYYAYIRDEIFEDCGLAESFHNRVESDGGEEALAWFHELRADFKQGTSLLLKNLEQYEEYELCAKVLEKKKQIEEDSLKIEKRLINQFL